MDLAVENLDERKRLEQSLLVQLKGRKIFWHGLGIGIGIVVVKHLYRSRGPGIAPALHEAAQFMGSAGIRAGLGCFVQFFSQHHGGTGRQLRPDLINILEANSHAAAGRERLNAKTLAVNPYAVPCLATQPIHRVRIVQGIGNAAVFLKIQPVGNFVFHKIDAFGGAQIIEGLLVAGQLARGAGVGVFELEGAFSLKKHESLALFVYSYQMRRKPLVVQRGLPFFGLGQMRSSKGAADAKGKQQPADHAPDQRPGRQAEQTVRPCPLGHGAYGGGVLNEQGPPIPLG